MARSLETPLFTKPLGVPARKAGGLDARTIELVQLSWARVLPIADVAATLFYDRLFELDPSLRGLFKSDLGEQKKKLMLTLGVAVDGLRSPAKLVPVLQTLGVRHAGYMVLEHHYDTVGEALIWTLREGLGEGFTPEVEAAWTELYGFVATVMKQAAAEATRAPPPRGIVVPPASGPLIELDLPTVGTVPLGGRTLPGGAEMAEHRLPSLAPRGENGAAHPAQASPEPGALRVPSGVQEMTVHVLVKLDAPPLVEVHPPPVQVQVQAPRAPEPAAAAVLGVGPLAAVLCAASAAGTALLLAAVEKGAPVPALFGAPLAVTALMVSAFAAGHLAGRAKRQATGS